MEPTPTHEARESNPTESDSRALPVMSIQFTKWIQSKRLFLHGPVRANIFLKKQH